MKDVLTKGLGILSGFVASLSLLILYLVPTRLSFVLVIAIWWMILFATNRVFKFGSKSLFLHLSSSVASIALFSLIEWEPLLWFLIIVSGFLFFILWEWSVMLVRKTSGIKYKTWRRITMMIWVFNMYSFFTVIFAIRIFFQGTPMWLLSLVGGVFAGFGAAMIWDQYFEGNIKSFTLWILILSIITIELMWIMQLLPLGYLILGLLLTWIWYICQLFIRFNLTKHGILWKSQRWFLLVNALLFSAVLYFVKWI